MLTPQPLAVPRVAIAEALRLEATVPWVLARWPRVSTALAQIDLQGYRVAWISGTAPDDLAGSLTYYFTEDQKLKQIVFQGSTADARRLVATVAQRFNFKRQQAENPSTQLYQVRWNGKAFSEMKIDTAPIVRADHTQPRYRVSLVINNPDVR